jgi:hypothetical protein
MEAEAGSETRGPSSAMATRQMMTVWLVGHQSSTLTKANGVNTLPISGHVLRRLYHELKTNKQLLPSACSIVADEVVQLWEMAHIPTTQKTNVVSKLKSLYNCHIKVGKNKTRRMKRQEELEEEFSIDLNKLFDVAHNNSEKLICIKEDWEFLLDQRGDRNMVMSGEDKLFRMAAEKRQKRKIEEIKRQENEEQRLKEMSRSHTGFTSAEMEETKEDHEVTEEEDEEHRDGKRVKYPCDWVNSQPQAPQPMPSKRALLQDPAFIASLDRTGTSVRKAMHIVAPALKAVGVDLSDVSLSTTSIYVARKKGRDTIDKQVRKDFKPNTPLVAHFDGKLLPNIEGGVSDRMPVVVSGKGIEKLLGIPNLFKSTGVVMGNAVVEFINEWEGVNEWLAGLCFDTTSANTGIHTGAITVIQRAFDKRLLFLACRHHILEIIASAVFDNFFTATGPQIPLFSRFKNQWSSIDQSAYSSVKESLSPIERQWLEDHQDSVIKFLESQLARKSQPRQDYLELIKLSLLMLGKPVSNEAAGGIQVISHVFSPPGAYHRARWMAKGIYSLKIFAFRAQFKLTTHETQALRRICLFTITIYVQAWFSAPLAADAPYNDLAFCKILETYHSTDEQVATVAFAKLKGHLWYLSEDLVCLSLFSKLVSLEDKRAMTSALAKPETKKDLRKVNCKTIQSFQEKQLHDFVTRRSLNLFTALKIDTIFLQEDPAGWNEHCASYVDGRSKVTALLLINDCAERAVKLASDFNMTLTKDESQQQLVFQVIEHHRQMIMEPQKKHYL